MENAEREGEEEENLFEDFKISTTVAHLILLGSSVWALNQISISEHPWAKISFSLTMSHAALGIALHLLSKQKLRSPPSKEFVKIYWRSSMMVKSVPLLCINMQFMGVRMLNSLYTVLPVISRIQWKSEEKQWNCFNTLNILVLVYFALAKKDAWVSGMAALGTMIHLVTTRYFSMNTMKPDSIGTIALSIINVFGIQAIYAQLESSAANLSQTV